MPSAGLTLALGDLEFAPRMDLPQSFEQHVPGDLGFESSQNPHDDAESWRYQDIMIFHRVLVGCPLSFLPAGHPGILWCFVPCLSANGSELQRLHPPIFGHALTELYCNICIRVNSDLRRCRHRLRPTWTA